MAEALFSAGEDSGPSGWWAEWDLTEPPPAVAAVAAEEEQQERRRLGSP